MNTSNSGAAREVDAGRLAHFEDSDDEFTATPAISLPPRTRRRNQTVESPPPSAQPVTEPTPDTAPARKRSTAADHVAPTASSDAPEAKSRDTSDLTDATGSAGKGIEDRVRPSNVHIPVDLLPLVEEKCRTGGLSHGELIIIAIEAAHPSLRELIHPAATAGGNLFAPRRSRAARSTDGPLTPLNYRLRAGDFATLDQLVDQFGASSRGHLITAALTHYLRQPQ